MEIEKKKLKSIDPELKRQIKEMEAKQREEALSSAEVSFVEPAGAAAAIEKVSFDQWWMLLNMKKKFRPSMKEIIWADFKARGLSRNETKEAFDEALKLFGI